MTIYTRPLSVLIRAGILVTAIAGPSTAATQAASCAGAVQMHRGLSAATTTDRCAKRNTASGTARLSGYFSSMSTESFNPYQGSYVPPGLFEGYFVYDNNLKLVPQMTREVPTLKNRGIRDGGKTIILHLKSGLRWSNGAEITSADAKFGALIDCGTLPCGDITRLDTPDRYTVVFHLARVAVSFIPNGLPSIWPTKWPGAWNGDPHAAALKLGNDPTFNFKGPNYPTDGPYQVARVVDNKMIVLKPMKYYRTMNCGAYIGTIEDVLYPSLASQIAAAAAGKIDHLRITPIGLDQLPEIERHTDAYTVHLGPSFRLERVEFNVDPTYNGTANPLHDTKIRLALTLAIDKRRLIKAGLGVSRRKAQSLVAWTPWLNTPKLTQAFADKSIKGQWDPLAHAYLTDTGQGRALADARRLLSSTKWKHGFALDFLGPGLLRVRHELTELEAAWAPLGVTMHPTLVDNPFKLFDSWDNGGLVAHGRFQVLLDAKTTGADPDNFRFSLDSSSIDRRHTDHKLPGGNYSGIDDSVIDRGLRTAGGTFNRRIRSSNYIAVQREMNAHAYWMPIYFTPDPWTVNRHLLNTSSNALEDLYWNVWAWKVRGQ